MNYHYQFKFILFGNSNVGKSCIMHQFLKREFKEKIDPTIGVDLGSKIINIDDKVLKLQIWDTAGQENYRCITTSYFRG